MVENGDKVSGWKAPTETEGTLLISNHSFTLPPNLSKLIMNDDRTFQWHFTKPKPNRWRRMWYWILLGWKWEDVDDG